MFNNDLDKAVMDKESCEKFKSTAKLFICKEEKTGNEITYYLNKDGHILVDNVVIKTLDY